MLLELLGRRLAATLPSAAAAGSAGRGYSRHWTQQNQTRPALTSQFIGHLVPSFCNGLPWFCLLPGSKAAKRLALTCWIATTVSQLRHPCSVGWRWGVAQCWAFRGDHYPSLQHAGGPDRAASAP